MSGTDWTEPGKGATVAEICDALTETAKTLTKAREFFASNQSFVISASSAVGARHAEEARDRLAARAGKEGLQFRTNIVLTGEPLGPDDLRRIEGLQNENS